MVHNSKIIYYIMLLYSLIYYVHIHELFRNSIQKFESQR